MQREIDDASAHWKIKCTEVPLGDFVGRPILIFFRVPGVEIKEKWRKGKRFRKKEKNYVKKTKQNQRKRRFSFLFWWKLISTLTKGNHGTWLATFIITAINNTVKLIMVILISPLLIPEWRAILGRGNGYGFEDFIQRAHVVIWTSLFGPVQILKAASDIFYWLRNIIDISWTLG